MTNVMIEKTQDYLIVKIPLRAVKEGRARISPKNKRIIDEAINEGLSDIEAGRVFGPFASVKEFKTALRTATR